MNVFWLCIKIFLVRILDVSMGTTRTLYVVRGKRGIATMIGFVEIMIWFLIVREALNTPENSIWIAVAYASGFATGTFLGSRLAEKLISGNVSVRVITSNQNNNLIEKIREGNFAVTVVEARGKEDKEKYMLFITLDKNKLQILKDLIHLYDKNAFVTVDETKFVENGYFK